MRSAVGVGLCACAASTLKRTVAPARYPRIRIPNDHTHSICVFKIAFWPSDKKGSRAAFDDTIFSAGDSAWQTHPPGNLRHDPRALGGELSSAAGGVDSEQRDRPVAGAG